MLTGPHGGDVATDATLANIRRKSTFVDDLQMHGSTPLFSWIELSVTELCNRACAFCPRSEPADYPNQALHMSIGLAHKLGDELRSLDYRGAVVLCGFGEPLLHPMIEEIVAAFDCRVEIVTNGDRLTADKARSLARAGCDYVAVSAYDGQHQVDLFDTLFADAGIGRDGYIVRDRWQGEADNFGLSYLTNRAGAVAVGRQRPIDATRPCFYPSYQMTVDWNGDVLLCPHDWVRRIRFGNAQAQTLMEIWTSPAMRRRRMHLARGRAGLSPCGACNADGCVHGSGHATAWRQR